MLRRRPAHADTMPRFAANLSMLFGEVPFPDRFAAAARAGFRGVEFLFPYAYEADRLRELAARAGVEVVLFNLPPGDWDAGERGLACLPDRVTEFREGVARAVAYARALGCPRLHCMAGLRPPAVAEERLRETYLDNLRWAAREVARDGLVLLVEAINPRDMPGYWLTRSAGALALVREAGEPNLRVQLDAYHEHVMDGDAAAVIARELGWIGHVQVADVPGRHEPGTGRVDYPAFFALLDRLGYPGWVGCEYRPLGTTEAGLGWLSRWR